MGLVLAFCVAVDLGALVNLADFCARPDENFLAVAEEKLREDRFEIVAFYVKCGGANPITDAVASAADGIAALRGTVGDCEPKEAADAILSACDQAAVLLEQLERDAECDHIHNIYQALVQEHACRDILTNM